jgi:hypothetical protein
VFGIENDEDIFETLTQLIEQETEKKIFTMRILDEIEEWLEVLVIFEDKSMLLGKISVLTFFGNIACRLQAKYI